MHRREKCLDSGIVRARLPLFHPGGGGTRGPRTGGNVIADSAKYFQLIGPITPMAAMTAVDHGGLRYRRSHERIVGAGTLSISLACWMLNSATDRRHFGAESTGLDVGHRGRSNFTADAD